MNKIIISLLIGSVFLFTGCKKTKVASIAERIAKIWVISVAKEGSTLVYQTGNASNPRPGYSGFTIEIASTGTVVFVDFDGTRFSGNWEVIGENKLVLKNLSPQPTGSGGTIEFTINELTDASLTLTRTTASNKTGGTVNNYVLVVR